MVERGNSEHCVAKVVWTIDENSRAMRHHFDTPFRKGLRVFHYFFFSVLLLIFLTISVAELVDDARGGGVQWPMLIGALACVLLLFVWRLEDWSWRSAFKKRPDANTETEWILSINEIRTKSAFGESVANWTGFKKVLVKSDGFLFYRLDNLFFWLPFDAFESHECVRKVRKMIKEHGYCAHSGFEEK